MTTPTIDPRAIRPIRLRRLALESNLVLAPMAGVSNLPFRLIAREAGAALVFSETLSAKALASGGRKTWRMLETSSREAPVAFQLFGSDPGVLGEASRRLEAAGVEWLDLNCGCPVKKFVKNGAGAALLRDLPRATAIVRAMRRGFSGTLSVKMRAGWDAGSIHAPEFARLAAAEGAELVSVHGRTAVQHYAGCVDRGLIRRVVEAVPETPVLANGDVATPSDVFDMLRETGAAGVMIGRGALGNPWIFQQTLDLAHHGSQRKLTPAERLETIERHVALLGRSFPEPRLLAANLKKYVAAYSKGLPESAAFRRHALEARDLDVILGLTREYFGRLKRAA